MARKQILELEGKVNSKELVKEFENVQDEVKKTTKEVDNLGKKGTKDLEKVENQTKKTGKATKLLSVGVKAVGLAFKALGIGLIVAGIAKLTQAFTQNQKIMDGISTVFETVNIVFAKVTKAIINIVEKVNKATGGFDAFRKVISGLITLQLTPLKLLFFGIKLGLQEAQLAWEKSFFGDKDQNTIEELNKGIAQTRLDIVGVGKDAIQAGKDVATNYAEAIGEIGKVASIASEELGKISVEGAKEQAEALVEARKAAELSVAQQQLLIEKYDKQAEIQRQIRDDDRNSISERIKANKALNDVLELQQEAQLVQARAQIKAAELQLKVNDNVANNIALIQAQAEEEGVLAAIKGFQSEQKINEASLERELLQLQNSRTEAESKLSFEKKRAAAEEIEGELARLERLKEIAVDEREFETKRLQEKINNTKAETQARIDAEIEFAQKKFELDQKVKASSDKITEFNKKKAETDKDIDKKVNDSKIQMAQQSLGQIGSLLSESAEAQKAVGIATALIDTYKGITAGVALGFPAAIPAVAAAAATGFATVKKILSTKLPTVKGATGGGGASGGTRSAQAVAPQAVAPSFNVVGDSGSNQITDAINTQGSKPARAYVVSKDITTQQELDRNTQGNSSLG
jgi:hypothetical protein